jgi:hypothetical protein
MRKDSIAFSLSRQKGLSVHAGPDRWITLAQQFHLVGPFHPLSAKHKSLSSARPNQALSTTLFGDCRRRRLVSVTNRVRRQALAPTAALASPPPNFAGFRGEGQRWRQPSWRGGDGDGVPQQAGARAHGPRGNFSRPEPSPRIRPLVLLSCPLLLERTSLDLSFSLKLMDL